MQAKINYINQQLAQGTETAEAGYQRKCRKLEMKIEQVAKDNSKVKDKLAQEGGISDQHNSTLASQYLRLRNEREMQWHLL